MATKLEEVVKIENLIIPDFHKVLISVIKNEYSHYWLSGGRGSTKSSFVPISIIINMMKDGSNGDITNCIAIRKVKDTLRGSVFAGFMWAIELLGVSHLWEEKVSPMEIIYIPTGQKILFKGADKPAKLKSTKFETGYCKYLWYEELEEFSGMEEIRNINQSLMRGGKDCCAIYSYNPPKSKVAWVNIEKECIRKDRLNVHTTYKSVPIRKGFKWLGKQFYIEARELRNRDFEAYRHEYLGIITGVKGLIFPNVVLEEITDFQIAEFDNSKKRYGIDWGYGVDPFHFLVLYVELKKKILYIYDEITEIQLSNEKAYNKLKNKMSRNDLIVCDSSEPKSRDEFRRYGARIDGAKKGPDSIEYGIKFLQSFEKIIIDSQRCPNTAREFKTYELGKDRNGNYISKFPDVNNHSIDACRYALENDLPSNNNNAILF